MKGEIKKFFDLEELSSAVAKNVSGLIDKVVSSKGVFYLALSGGSTPETLYHILGTNYTKEVPWECVHIFFCDERYVSHDDHLSNFLMVKESLLNFIPISKENVHPIPTDRPDANIAARDYETELRRIFSDTKNTGSTSLTTSFDLAIMGIGKEGHTASLFPNSPVLDEGEDWTAAVEVQALPPQRITLTYPILNLSSNIYFLAAGSDKSGILNQIRNKDSNFHTYPALGIQPISGKLVWWVDIKAMPNHSLI